MDPLSALSVAASVAQFLEFGGSLVSKSQQIFRSVDGALPTNIRVEDATKRLNELSEGIKSGLALSGQVSNFTTKEDDALLVICDGCIAASDKLLSKLDKLKVHDNEKMRRFKSIRQALKSVWSQKSLDELAEQLKNLRAGRMHIGKFNNLSLLQDKKFTALDETIQRSIEPLLRHLVDIRAKLDVMSSQHDICDLARDHRKRSTGRLNSDSEDSEYEAAKNWKINAAVLHALDFSARMDRQYEISEAYQQTFEWIFNLPRSQEELHVTSSQEERPWSNFVEWLRGEGNSTSAYWINGKAGSGKSTLMQFIVSHSETERHLRHWAGDADLQICSFFFWNSGTGLQYSRQGLLRSLLFSALNKRPELTRELFKAEWRETSETKKRWGNVYNRQWDIPVRRLEQVFNRLIQLATAKFRLCFFIDGLDESKEGPEELISIIEEAVRSPFIKICVSSRPWLVFEEAFKNTSSLRLQDLSYRDIKLFVQERLQQDTTMKRLETVNPGEASSLVRDIVAKANGVFLWVNIATKSLLAGLRNWDDISDLQRRLDQLPSDLNALYSHMLDRIEPIYTFQASKIFRIFDATAAMKLRPTILELDLAVHADYYTAIATTEETPTDSELEYRCQRMTAHLKSRCEGLLEVHDAFDRHWESVHDDEKRANANSRNEKQQEPQEHQEKRLRSSLKVSYIHRTVKDFLNIPSVRKRLEDAARDEPSSIPPFDPHFSLLMSYVIDLRLGLRSYYYDGEIPSDERLRKATLDAISFAGKMDESNSKAVTLLHAFQTQSLKWWNDLSRTESGFKFSSTAWDEEFLAMVTYHGLWVYVKEIIEKSTQLLRTEGEPGWPVLLRLALGLSPPIDIPGQLYRPSPALVKCLLSHGSNPNTQLGPLGQSIWEEFLQSLNEKASTESNVDAHYTKVFEIIKYMLDHGADIGTGERGYTELDISTSIDTVIETVFSKASATETDLLRSIVKQKRATRKRQYPSEARQTSSKRHVVLSSDR